MPPSSTEPEIGLISPKRLLKSVVLPIPFEPTTATFCPLSSNKFKGFDKGLSYPITKSFVSKISLSEVLPATNLNSGFGFSFANSIMSILSSFFCLALAIPAVATLALFFAIKV